MTRVATSNYAGSPTTTFEWATAGTDRFSRVLDLYALAQALEAHDHTTGKGLAVGRIINGLVGTLQLANGAVDSTKLGTDAVTAIAVALDAIGALELADNSVDTAAIQALAVTAAKMAAGAAATNIAGGTVPGTLTVNGNLAGLINLIALNSGAQAGALILRKGGGANDTVITPGATFTDIYNSAVGGPALRIPDALASDILHNGFKMWDANNDGVGSGLDAGMVIGKVPTATPAAAAIPIADGSGKLDSWVTAAAGVVLTGIIAHVATAAAIPSGWGRCDGAGGRPNIDGRMIVGAGTTFSTTYNENTAYGSSWSHGHTTNDHTHGGFDHSHPIGGNTGTESADNGLGNNGGTNTPAVGHTHSLPANTTAAGGSFSTGGMSGGAAATSSNAWVIPAFAAVTVIKS